MAEPRRTSFTTIGPAGEETDEKNRLPTVRFDLSLFNTTDSSCPEFSFTDLMKDALPSPEDLEKKENDDPFGDVDAVEAAKMATIAQQFEEKYTPKPGKRKKKHTYNRYQDLIDFGDGYDETDPFVDNSEAYDEIVPACLTTRLGGFYINSGRLDFKEMSDDSMSEFQNKLVKKKTKKKRVLIDSDSEDEKRNAPKNKLKVGGDEKKRKKHLGDGEQPFKKPKRPLNKDRVKVHRKKLSPSVSELLKQQSESTSVVNGIASDVDLKSPSSTPHDATENQNYISSKLDNIIDSVISMSKENDSDSRDMEEEKKPVDPDTILKLPVGLPSDLEQTLDKIKQAARESRDGKCKFFTDEVNKMLLDIELSTRQLPCGNRSNIYANLAAFLPCAKETLLKRAKKLRLSMHDDKLKIPLQKLQDAITRVMPGVQQKYEATCQLYAQTKAAQEEGKDESKDVKEKEEGKEDISTESDDEGKTNEEVKKKANFVPRKKFEWNQEIKSLLCEIVKIKMGLYSLSKVRSQSPEEYVRSFLDREVKVLWPKGWIQTRMLYKESREAHGSWTNLQKLRKSVLQSKPMGPAVNVSPGQMVKSLTNPVSTVASPNIMALTLPAIGPTSVSVIASSVLPSPDFSLNRMSDTKLTVSRSSPIPHSKLTAMSPTPQSNQQIEARHSPTPQGKLISKLLDYAAEDHSVGLSQFSKSSTLSTADIPKSCTEKKTSPLLSPASKMSATAVEKSFQHCISDLIRDALESYNFQSKLKIETSRQPTPPKVTLPSGVQDSFFAQFQKYASVVTGTVGLSKTQASVQNHPMKPNNQNLTYQMSNQEQALKILANEAQGMKKLPTQGHSIKRLSDQGHPTKQIISPTKLVKELASQRMDHHEVKQIARSHEEDKHRSLLVQQSAPKQTIQTTTASRSLLQKAMGQPVQKVQSRVERNVSVPKCDVSSIIHNQIIGSSPHTLLQSYSTNSAGRGLSRAALVVNESLGNHSHPSCASTQASPSKVVYRSTSQTGHTSQTSSSLKPNLSASNVPVPNQMPQDLATTHREKFGNLMKKYYTQSDSQLVSVGKQLQSPGLQSPRLPLLGLTSPILPISIATIGYRSPYSIPKPIPSYQNVKLSNLSRDQSPQSAMHIPSQVSPGGLPGSVGTLFATPQGQLMVSKTSPVSKQTSSHSQGLYPPHISQSRKYGTYYPESSPHGY